MGGVMTARFFLSLLVLLSLAGCSSLRNPGAPPAPFTTEQDLKDILALEAPHQFVDTIPEYYSNPGKETRNQFVSARLVITDLHYIEFVKEVAVNKAQLDTFLDVTSIGLDLAAALVGSAATSAMLAAASAGVTGSRISYDKNFFYEETIETLVSAMNARRKEALVPIVEGTGKSIQEYPFEHALTDLHVYYEAGTFAGALQAIRKDASLKEAKAERDIDRLRVSIFAQDESSDRIIAWLWQDGRQADDAGSPLPPIPENAAALRKWTDDNIGDIPIQRLLDSPDLVDLRKKAIEDLKIPEGS
jgi:hypothetical protein